jgi:hypothetical protein
LLIAEQLKTVTGQFLINNPLLKTIIIMKLKMILLLVVFCIYTSPAADAQIRSILRDKAREALRTQEEKEEERIEQERSERREEEKPRQPTAFEKRMEQRMMKAMGFADLKYEDQYNFRSSMSMDVENYDAESDELSRITYTTYFNKDDESFAMRFSAKNEDTGNDESTLMIFDMKNHVMLMLSESGNEKSGMAFSIAPDSTGSSESYVPDETEETEDTGLYGDTDTDHLNLWHNKTGRTKTISGYKCEEYTWEDEEGRIEYWFSPEARFDYSSAYNYMGGFQALAMGGFGFNGILMEMNHIDKKSGNRAKMLVNEINADNPSTIDLKGIQVMGFAGGGN